MTFRNRTALVTGAGSGIGAQTAKALAAEGAQVVCSDIDGAAATRVADQITAAGGAAIALQHDVAVAESSRKAVDFAVQEFGGLHLAVNNAAVTSNGDRIADVDPVNWDHDIQVNLSGVFYGLRYQIPALLEAGGGAIVNLSSVMGWGACTRNASYVAAKHAVIGLTKAAALEYSPRGVRVNAVSPGYIATEGLGTLDPERIAAIAARHPVGRLGEPGEVADLIVFLLSDRASFITGSCHLVDGGYVSGWRGANGDA